MSDKYYKDSIGDIKKEQSKKILWFIFGPFVIFLLFVGVFISENSFHTGIFLSLLVFLSYKFIKIVYINRFTEEELKILKMIYDNENKKNNKQEDEKIENVYCDFCGGNIEIKKVQKYGDDYYWKGQCEDCNFNFPFRKLEKEQTFVDKKRDEYRKRIAKNIKNAPYSKFCKNCGKEMNTRLIVQSYSESTGERQIAIESFCSNDGNRVITSPFKWAESLSFYPLSEKNINLYQKRFEEVGINIFEKI